MSGRRLRLLGALLPLVAAPLQAAEPLTLAAQGQLQVAFTPGDDAGALVVATIAGAKRQVLVQAYSFTHRAIADALIAARRRGVDVQVIADPQQARTITTSVIEYLADQGVPVLFDGEHPAAHNKVMVIDPELDTAAVVTGSFNFTHAAQYRNAENLLVLRGHPLLAQAYAANWRRHRTHALRLWR
ncbi:MAG: phospholipase D family protein [Thiobacillaceae bacterium]|nr:phospholipase D family protein [Thiobacillaceae bacterium]